MFIKFSHVITISTHTLSDTLIHFNQLENNTHTFKTTFTHTIAVNNNFIMPVNKNNLFCLISYQNSNGINFYFNVHKISCIPTSNTGYYNKTEELILTQICFAVINKTKIHP